MTDPGLVRVDRDARADVWVVRGDQPPPRLPARRPAVLAIGAEKDANLGWLEESVDGWAPAEAFVAAGAAADIVRRAWAARVALQPSGSEVRWLEAVRIYTGADVAGRITPTEAEWAGTSAGLEALWEAPTSLARRARSAVVVPSAAALITQFGVTKIGVDAVVALPFGPRTADGILLLLVRADGERWARRAVGPARRVVDAAALSAAQRRANASEIERSRFAESMGRLMSIVSHDLRSPLFAMQLGVKVLERQNAPSESVAVLSRATASASDLLRRLVDAGRSVIEPPVRASGNADLTEVWTRVAEETASKFPGRALVGPELGQLEHVSMEPKVLELLIRTILQNAMLHGAPDCPVRVGCSVEAGEVVVEVRNRGRLPFPDLAQLQPFEHRANGGLGVGLFVARRVAEAAGARLTVRQVDGEVAASLGMSLVH